MNFGLKWEEEALASRETPLESHLLDVVRELVEGEDDGGLIFKCSWCQGRPQLASPLTMTNGFEVLDGVKADLSI